MSDFYGNVLKAPPWFGGQFGVPGSDTPLGFRTQAQGIVYYVDASHPDCNNNADGTDPNQPLATIQAAITKNNATIDWAATPPYVGMNTIVVAPGRYNENLTPPYYCKIIGLGLAYGGGGDISADVHPTAGAALAGTGLACWWYNIRFTCDTAAPCVNLGVMNSCVFDSCCFVDGNPGLATTGLTCTDAGGSVIRNCRVFGNTNPHTIGLLFSGDAYACVIAHNQIHAVTTGIHLSDAAGLAGQCLIAHNYISKPVNGIVCATGAPMVIDNWIAATGDCISHPDADLTIANHVTIAGVGAVELTGTD